MSKNKKVNLITVAALTTLFATGCGMKPKNIEEKVDSFVESHNEIEITESKLPNSNVVVEFLKKIARNSADEETIRIDIEGDDGLMTYKGKNGGCIDILTTSNGSKLSYISIDVMSDISDISGEIKTVISKFCDEALYEVGIGKEDVLRIIGIVYNDISSDEYLNSEEAKNDINEYGFVQRELEIGGGAYIKVTIYNPLESKTEMVNVTIGIRG